MADRAVVPQIDGNTRLIAHIGYPTRSFRAPLIYNPWFAHTGTNCVVVPMACPAGRVAGILPAILALENVVGALITMPHKIAVTDLLDEAAPSVEISGACNAVRRLPDGRLSGAMFDGAGFVRALSSAGHTVTGSTAQVIGTGGVGSAISAALAEAGAGAIRLSDTDEAAADRLAARLRAHFPDCAVTTRNTGLKDVDIAVNATPLGMKPDDPQPFDVTQLRAGTIVGDVVLPVTETALIAAARARNLDVVTGPDMLFEQIPAYLDFFGLPPATAAELRKVSADAGPAADRQRVAPARPLG